jgi:hypothetical protein
MVTQADKKYKEKKNITHNRDIFCMGHLYLIIFEGLMNVDANIQPGYFIMLNFGVENKDGNLKYEYQVLIYQK